MNLFQKQDITLHSGAKSDFKIDCDALTDQDLECLAYLISKQCNFRYVFGVPTGGERLAKKLLQYEQDDPKLPTLIVDDVLTTGDSMEDFKYNNFHDVIGYVIFARGECPRWVNALFQLN